jgi:hypothetical protein
MTNKRKSPHACQNCGYKRKFKSKLKAKKPKAKKETEFDVLLKETTDLVAKHLDDLGIKDVNLIVKEALTGKPSIKEQKPEGGTDGKLNAYLNENFGRIGPTEEEMWKGIGEAVANARTKYPVRADRNAGFVDLYPSVASQMNKLEDQVIKDLKENRMKSEQLENLDIIDEELKKSNA